MTNPIKTQNDLIAEAQKGLSESEASTVRHDSYTIDYIANSIRGQFEKAGVDVNAQAGGGVSIESRLSAAKTRGLNLK